MFPLPLASAGRFRRSPSRLRPSVTTATGEKQPSAWKRPCCAQNRGENGSKGEFGGARGAGEQPWPCCGRVDSRSEPQWRWGPLLKHQHRPRAAPAHVPISPALKDGFHYRRPIIFSQSRGQGKAQIRCADSHSSTQLGHRFSPAFGAGKIPPPLGREKGQLAARQGLL